MNKKGSFTKDISEYFVTGFEKLTLCRTGGIQFLYIIRKYSEEVLVQCKAYFITFSSTADRGSTSFQHLGHCLFINCGTVDCGSTSFQLLVHCLFIDYGTADHGSSRF